MTANCARGVRALAGLLICLSAALPALASPSRLNANGRGTGFAYNKKHEIAVIGTVKGFAPLGERRGPVGLHLLLSSSGKEVDAHIGSYVSKENIQALRAGQLVQIVGVNESVHGHNVLLARQIIFNGRQVTIRNEHGFLVRNIRSRRKALGGKAAVNGGGL